MARKTKPKKRAAPRSPAITANVKVVGVGGGGGKIVHRISRDFVRGVDFVVINTDNQDLDQCGVRQKIYIGRNLTKGLGTGMNPDLGRQAAEENRSEIAEALKGADLVFIAAGGGGGTGTGAMLVVAEAAQQAGALTIAVVTRPFSFEGGQRERIAQEGIMKLKDKVDALVVVPNDRIFTIISKETPILKAFEAIDDVLRNALRGIVEMIAAPGIINVDFADVRTIMQNAGPAIVGIGLGSGPDRAMNAVGSAVNSPLLEASAEGAKAVLLGIAGGRDLRMTEVNDAARLVAQMADPGARIIFGAYHDRNLRPNQVKVTLIASGFNGASKSSLFSNPASLSRSETSSYDGRQAVLGGSRPDMVAPAGKIKPVEIRPKAQAAPKDEGDEEEGVRAVSKPAAKKEEKKERDSDIWDIPAFLRRRKK